MNYTTQMDAARKGLITPAMERVAKEENMELTLLQERLAQGTIVIPANKLHTRLVPCGVGQGLRTKINVNLGVSKDCCHVEGELEKVKTAIAMKADAIMDLSCYGKTREFRRKIIEVSPAMLGTVSMYEIGRAHV